MATRVDASIITWEAAVAVRATWVAVAAGWAALAEWAASEVATAVATTSKLKKKRSFIGFPPKETVVWLFSDPGDPRSALKRAALKFAYLAAQ